jgi:hypothetical protein
MIRRVATALLALFIAASALEYVPVNFGLKGAGLVPPVEARVGRPLTPVSVAGVGRRTVRRCAVGVYYC